MVSLLPGWPAAGWCHLPAPQGRRHWAPRMPPCLGWEQRAPAVWAVQPGQEGQLQQGDMCSWGEEGVKGAAVLTTWGTDVFLRESRAAVSRGGKLTGAAPWCLELALLHFSLRPAGGAVMPHSHLGKATVAGACSRPGAPGRLLVSLQTTRASAPPYRVCPQELGCDLGPRDTARGLKSFFLRVVGLQAWSWAGTGRVLSW